jgi:hypothetical protein
MMEQYKFPLYVYCNHCLSLPESECMNVTPGGGGRETTSLTHTPGPSHQRNHRAYVQCDPRSSPRPPGCDGRGSGHSVAQEHGLLLVTRVDDGTCLLCA